MVSTDPKFGSLQCESWLRHEYPKAYAVEQTGSQQRLRIGVSSGGARILRELSATLESPFFLLYVLVVPRGGSTAGRYQSPELMRDDLEPLIDRFGEFWDSDARHSVWIRSIPEAATLVYDRHNLLYAYGPLDKFRAVLERLTYSEVPTIEIPAPHQHSYLLECDGLERECVSALDWHRTDLHPKDEE